MLQRHGYGVLVQDCELCWKESLRLVESAIKSDDYAIVKALLGGKCMRDLKLMVLQSATSLCCGFYQLASLELSKEHEIGLSFIANTSHYFSTSSLFLCNTMALLQSE